MSDLIEEALLRLFLIIVATIILFSVVIGSSYGLLLLLEYVFESYPEIENALNATEFSINIYAVILIALLLSICTYTVIKMSDQSSNLISIYGEHLSRVVGSSISQLEVIAINTSENNELLERIRSGQSDANIDLDEIKHEVESIKGEAENIKDEIKSIAWKIDDIER